VSSEALLVEVYAGVAVVEFSLQVLEFMDAALTGIYNRIYALHILFRSSCIKPDDGH
jgi:hypothetical protein